MILNSPYLFEIFTNYLPFKGDRSNIWLNFKTLQPRMLCAKFGWNRSSGYIWREGENVKKFSCGSVCVTPSQTIVYIYVIEWNVELNLYDRKPIWDLVQEIHDLGVGCFFFLAVKRFWGRKNLCSYNITLKYKFESE